MFHITGDQCIHITRGDIAAFDLRVEENGVAYAFRAGDMVRLSVFSRKNMGNVVLQKDFLILEDAQAVDIHLEAEDTKFGELINKPTDYWYEITLNPDTLPQTVVGYDQDGPKIFRLYPEGGSL